jgi:hypothetical protein
MTKPTHAEIQAHAYHLWSVDGSQPGNDLHWWFLAEFELLHGWNRLPKLPLRQHNRDPYNEDL